MTTAIAIAIAARESDRRREKSDEESILQNPEQMKTEKNLSSLQAYFVSLSSSLLFPAAHRERAVAQLALHRRFVGVLGQRDERATAARDFHDDLVVVSLSYNKGQLDVRGRLGAHGVKLHLVAGFLEENEGGKKEGGGGVRERVGFFFLLSVFAASSAEKQKPRSFSLALPLSPLTVACSLFLSSWSSPEEAPATALASLPAGEVGCLDFNGHSVEKKSRRRKREKRRREKESKKKERRDDEKKK